MKVTVIIPTFNHSDLIIRSLETWTKQTYTDFEVLIVDNNSTDNTEQAVDEYIKALPHFRYLKELKPGATSARHAGARIATGEILVFADDDGLFNDNCLNALIDVYVQYPEVSAVTGKIELLWDSVPPAWIEPYSFMLGKLDYGNTVKTGFDLYLNGGLFSIRKSVFEELGGFNPDLAGDYLIGDGDTGLVNKLHESGKLIGYTPDALMQHLQFVSKQGTVKGLGRRFFNTGISNTYTLFRKFKFKPNLNLLLFFLKSLFFYCKKGTEYLLTGKKEMYFSFMERRGQIAFFINLLRKSVRNEVLSTENYNSISATDK